MDVNKQVSDIVQDEHTEAQEVSHTTKKNRIEGISTDEKIDYIYHYIKRQERSALVKRYVKIVFYLGIIAYFYIMITVVLPRTLSGILPGVDIGSIKERIFGGEGTSSDVSESSDAISDILKRLERNNF